MIDLTDDTSTEAPTSVFLLFTWNAEYEDTRLVEVLAHEETARHHLVHLTEREIGTRAFVGMDVQRTEGPQQFNDAWLTGTVVNDPEFLADPGRDDRSFSVWLERRVVTP